MDFTSVFSQYSWDTISENIYSKKKEDVERAFSNAGHANLDDFMALISPAAAPYLEKMAELSQQLTQKRFGKTVQMYIPMYLSNECKNICTYCGFSVNNKIPRKVLSDEEILDEVKVIKSLGYDHILLVTGEDQRKVGLDYLENAIQLVQPFFSNISLEVQPLEQAEYARLSALGLYSVLVYQETYHKETYKTYHTKGKKSLLDYRLKTPDRLGNAKVHKIGLGCLIGLEDWRVDSWFVGLHLNYLEKKFWQTKFSISFPRIRPHVGDFTTNQHITDKELVQLICAYRIFNENVELSLSTRESPNFRDNVFPLGITSISAGSKTEPGGYSNPNIGTLEQFEIDDSRSPEIVSSVIKARGYEVIWKDWDQSMGKEA